MDQHRPAGPDARAPARRCRRAPGGSGGRRRRRARRSRPRPRRARPARSARTWRTRSRTPARSRFARKRSWSASPVAASVSISCGPRSVPACGSIAITSTPSGAAVASTIVERPRKLPISTMRPGGASAAAASWSRRGLVSLSQPSTPSIAARWFTPRRRHGRAASGVRRAPERERRDHRARARAGGRRARARCRAGGRRSGAGGAARPPRRCPRTTMNRALPSASRYCTAR